LRFLVDAQLPVRLVELFVSAGHAASHVADVGLLSATDADIRAYALRHGMIVVTKDEDFAIARQIGAAGPQVLWIRLGNTTNRVLMERMQPLLPEIFSALVAGEAVVEVR
jgi:predicted nuclease of predicted toxin-antitoxin system